MPFTHRGQSTGGNHTPISRAAKRDIKAMTEMSKGDLRNLPVEHVKSAVERHGEAIINPLFDSIQSHAKTYREQQYKQAQRAEKIEGLKKAVVNKVAPYRATAYEMDTGYGGAEEGGWYYDIQHPVADSRPFLTRGGAEKAASKMKEEYTAAPTSSGSQRDEETGEWRRGYRSSAYQGGDYRVYVQRGKGKYSPEERPYYE